MTDTTNSESDMTAAATEKSKGLDLPPEIEQSFAKALRGEGELIDAFDVDELFLENVEQKAYSFYASGRYHSAEVLLSGLNSLDSKRVYPNLLLGDIALRTGRNEKAREHLEAAYEQDASDPTITLKLAEVMLNDGETEPALGLLESALELADDGSPVANRATTLLDLHGSE